MQELKDKNNTELNDEILALRREQFNMRMLKGAQGATHSHSFKNIRRNIARIKTILSIRAKASK